QGPPGRARGGSLLRWGRGEPVDVGLAGAEVAALHGVVEQPPHRVAVVAVVLRRVDAALRGDAVRAARAVLEAEALDLVAELGERRGRRRAGEARADHEHAVLALVRRVDELQLEAALVPLVLDGTARDAGIELHREARKDPARRARLQPRRVLRPAT